MFQFSLELVAETVTSLGAWLKCRLPLRGHDAVIDLSLPPFLIIPCSMLHAPCSMLHAPCSMLEVMGLIPAQLFVPFTQPQMFLPAICSLMQFVLNYLLFCSLNDLTIQFCLLWRLQHCKQNQLWQFHKASNKFHCVNNCLHLVVPRHLPWIAQKGNTIYHRWGNV